VANFAIGTLARLNSFVAAAALAKGKRKAGGGIMAAQRGVYPARVLSRHVALPHLVSGRDRPRRASRQRRAGGGSARMRVRVVRRIRGRPHPRASRERRLPPAAAMGAPPASRGTRLRACARLPPRLNSPDKTKRALQGAPVKVVASPRPGRKVTYPWRMIFSDLPSPAEASIQTTKRATGFAQAGNRFPLFKIMRCSTSRIRPGAGCARSGSPPAS